MLLDRSVSQFFVCGKFGGGCIPSGMIKNHAENCLKTRQRLKKCGKKRSNFSNHKNKYDWLHIVNYRV